MVAALDEFMLSGVHHTAAFLRDVVAGEAFADARLSTRFIAEFFPNWRPSSELLDAALIGLVWPGQNAALVFRSVSQS